MDLRKPIHNNVAGKIIPLVGIGQKQRLQYTCSLLSNRLDLLSMVTMALRMRKNEKILGSYRWKRRHATKLRIINNNMNDQFEDLQSLLFVRKNIKSPMKR